MSNRKTSLNVSERVYDLLTDIKQRTGMTMTVALENAVTEYHARIMAEPGVVLGYIEVARQGDLDWNEADCHGCGQSIAPGSAWLEVGATVGQITLHGPLCSRCASSE